MGNYIGYSHKDFRASTRLGSNGRGMALLKLFAVAYASSGLPDARRARNGVLPLDGDSRFRVVRTRDDVKQLLARNDRDCFWADFHIGTAGAGFFSSPPRCDTYRAILVPLLLLQASGSRLLLPVENVELTSKAWRLMLPYLADCPALRSLTEITEMAEAAARHHATLEMS